MPADDERIEWAIQHTEVLRPPRQSLATFGTTNIHYYLLTEPLYMELAPRVEETVVREGRVIAERPKIVTPSYLVNLFEGFEHGGEYAQYMMRKYGPHEPGLLYRYKNEPGELNIVSDPLPVVARRLGDKIDRAKEPLTAIIKGVDEMWDISLMKFIHDLTRGSLASNITELANMGLLDIDSGGVPRDARRRIEELFEEVKMGRCEPFELKKELDRWGVFEEYQDRFLALFRKR